MTTITRAAGFPTDESTNSTNPTASWVTVGDCAIAAIGDFSSATVGVSALSSSKVTGWTKVGQFDSNRTGTPTHAWTVTIWMGTVNATGSDTITLTWSGTAPTSGNLEVVFDELSIGAAATWAAVTSSSLDTAAPATNSYPFPSLTSGAAASQAYWGYELYNGGGSGGTGTGFTFHLTAFTNVVALNGALAATTAYQPDGTSTGGTGDVTFAAGVIISATSSGSSGSATAAATTSVSASGTATAVGTATAAPSASVTATATLTKFGSATAAAAASVAVSGPVPFATAVSGNGRYLVDQFGKPFLVKGDSLWDLAWKDSTTQNTVLADRVSNGFNTIITDLSSNSATGMGTGSSNGANYNSEAPFTGTYSPNSTFWARIDSFLTLAASYGITVFAVPIDAYQTQSGQVFNGMTGAQATTFGTFLGGRYPQSSYPNIVWMLGNDYNGDGVGSGGATAFDTQYENMVAAIRATGDTRPVICELGYYESRTSDSAAMKGICSLNACYSYHDVYEVILTGRSAWTAPAIMIESAYENSGPDPSFDSNYYLRLQVGWTMTSGAAGEFYGNDSLWPLNGSWATQLDTTAVSQIKALRSAIQGTSWWTVNPDTSSLLVTSGRGTQFTGGSAGTGPGVTSSYVTAAYSADGTLGLVYNPDSTANSPVLSASVLGLSPTITKVDPANGATSSLGWTTTPSGGTNSAGNHDWLYIITAAQPGTATAASSVSVTASGTQTTVGAAAPTSTTSVTATGTLAKLGTAVPAPAASVAVSGTLTKLGTAAPAASTSVAATAVVTELGVAAPAAVTSVAATGAVPGSSTAQPAAAGSVAVTGLVTALGTSLPASATSVTAAGTVTELGSAAPASAVSVAASGTAIALGSAAPAASTTVTASGLSGLIGVVSPAAIASAVVSAVQTAFGAVTSAARAAVTAIGSVIGSTIVAPAARVSVQVGQAPPLGPVVQLVAPARTFILEVIPVGTLGELATYPASVQMATTDIINYQITVTPPSGGAVASVTTFLRDRRTLQPITLQDAPTFVGNVVTQIVRGAALILGRDYQLSAAIVVGQVNSVNITITSSTEIECVLQP